VYLPRQIAREAVDVVPGQQPTGELVRQVAHVARCSDGPDKSMSGTYKLFVSHINILFVYRDWE
jgi:hypothetical protein